MSNTPVLGSVFDKPAAIIYNLRYIVSEGII